MANSGTFATFLHHGGSFVMVGSESLYVGGNFVGRFGLDEDRFGFLDLVDEVKKLGYVKWDRLAYKVPRTEVYKDLQNDKDVMQMLSHLSHTCRVLSVYIDNGKMIGGDSASLGNETIGDESGDLTNLSCGLRNDNGAEIGEEGVQRKNGDGEDYSSEDLEYILPEKELTDDSLSDLDVSDDEHIEARQNIKVGKNVRLDFDTLLRGESCDGGIECEGNASDYESSSGDVNSSSTEDELDSVKEKRKKRLVYDPKCDHSKFKVKLGMRFEDGYQCREALKTSAIEQGLSIHFRRVTKHQLEAKCTPPCTLRCYGSTVKKDNTFIIKVLIGEHDCPRTMTNKLCSSTWIAKKYLNIFRVRPDMNVKDLENDILERYACRVSKWRLYSARQKAFQHLRGSVHEHYASIRRYIAELVRVDREGRFELLLGEESVFRGMYVGFSSLRKGFTKGCRPLIGLDGCFLKTHVGGALLSAIAKDGNNQMFPIAWAVVEAENEECWTWFLKILLEELQIGYGLGYTFISDQQKGLLNAISNLAPLAEHRNCARHVYCNWKKQFKGISLKNIFWRAVRSTYIEEYKLVVQAMKDENEAAYQDFIDRNVQKFCKAFISPLPSCDMIDNNVSETFNGYILHARGKYVINMLEEIRCRLMERQCKKLNLVTNSKDKLCPIVRTKLDKLKLESRYCSTHPALGEKFEVRLYGDQFVVSLGCKTCTCRVWDITGIPCVHACAAIIYLNEDPTNYVCEYFTVARYLEAYGFGLPPMTGEKMWPEVEGYPVQPPHVRKMPGRPKKKRRRDLDERCPTDPNKLKRFGLRMTCRRCQQVGHNSRGCKNEMVQKTPNEKGKLGRPRKQQATAPKLSRAKQQASSNEDGAIPNSAFITKKKAQASKGYGRVVGEHSRNIYMMMPSEQRVYFNPSEAGVGSSRRSGTKSNPEVGGLEKAGMNSNSVAGSSLVEMPTQESRS